MAKGCTNNSYEEARKQRLEENKKRFEDLGISRITKNLNELTSPGKKTPHHLPKPKSKTNGVVEPRRSSRVRNPVTSYREEGSLDLPSLRKRSRSNSTGWGSYVARPLDECKEATEEERICALEAAEAIQSNLQSSNPSFIKSMVRSHVYSCFWLGLPSKFCEDHLPKTVYDMILEDENGSEYEAIYIGKRSGLSGGWRAFALEHKLDDGDALVFELIEPARFKIYIVRAFPDSIEEDGKETLKKEGKMETLEEEGNMCATKAPKVASNLKSASNKRQKQKQAIVPEIIESTNSEEHLPEHGNGINIEVKMQGVSPTKKTKISQKKLQKKTEMSPSDELEREAKNEEGHICATEKPKETIHHKSQASKTRKSEDVVHATSELKNAEPIKEASKCISQLRRKKPAPKLFRKKA